MFNKKDYTSLSLAELLLKQTSLFYWKKIFITIAVVLVGMTLFAVYAKSKNMHPFLILGSLFFIFYNSSELKKVQLEIEKRKK
ncbi:hypothetical protein [Flavobacterium psychrophilum]|uniref:hypothetical protein n=1 Tax=Flavobacterium psychrophilum TaxID=96345 RepID=UPI000B7C4D5E|nr:hypothetical protein [Flavobacterium psychrophilum]SNB39147.1 conserved exported hypothetical protein [Flavobacterium psychrophilum]